MTDLGMTSMCSVENHCTNNAVLIKEHKLIYQE